MQCETEILADNPACNSDCHACHYKNLSYEQQIQKKNAWAINQLQSWQKVLNPLIPAPDDEQMAYRSKSWMRTDFKANQVSFGMHRSIRNQNKWEKEFVSWNSCPLHHSSIQKIIKNIKGVFSVEQIQELQESWVGIWFGRPHLVIVSKEANPSIFQNLNWDQILEMPFQNVWFHCNPQIGKKIFGHLQISPIAGPNLNTVHPIRAFRQVAQSLLTQARIFAVKELLRDRPEFILDLYCGTGEISQMLPKNIGWVGIEISPEAVEYANTLRKQNSVLHQAFTGAVEDRLKDPRVLNQLKGRFSVFINPPRPGMSDAAREKLVEVIRDHSPSTLVYLSCSASSLARDLRFFEKEGYTIELLQPYDFFPQTEHFETLAVCRLPSELR